MDERTMTDDWMTDEHRAAALEGFLSNPIAQAYARAHAQPDTTAMDEPTTCLCGDPWDYDDQHTCHADATGP